MKRLQVFAAFTQLCSEHFFSRAKFGLIPILSDIASPTKRTRESDTNEGPPLKKTKESTSQEQQITKGGKFAKENLEDLFPSFKDDIHVRKNYDGSKNVIHLLFDVNGTLGSLTKNAVYGPKGKVINYRPHIENLRKLEEHGYEIGVWSSARPENVSKHTKEIRKHGKLENPYWCVFDRAFTEPAPPETRQNSWDTVKPLRKIDSKFEKLSRDRLILIEDRTHKFVDDDLKNGILVQAWEEQEDDTELKSLIEFLLQFPPDTTSALSIAKKWEERRSGSKSKSASKGRSKSKSASKGRSKSKSASKGRSKSKSASKGRSKSKSASKGRSKSKSASKGRWQGKAASRSRSGSRSKSASPRRSRSSSPRGDDVRKGRVVKINQRGFGFLQVDGEKSDVWFHSNDIAGADIDIRQFREDDEIECKLQPSQKIRGNFEAVEVRPLDLKLVQGREEKGRRPSPGRGRDRKRRSRSRSRGRRRRSYSPPRRGRYRSRSRSPRRRRRY